MRNKAIDNKPLRCFARIDGGRCISCLSEISSLALQYRYENGRRYHKYREGRMCLCLVRVIGTTLMLVDTNFEKK